MTKAAKASDQAPGLAVKFWLYVSNNGDGSASGHLFASQEEARAYAGLDENGDSEDSEQFTEADPVEITLRVDENGKLLPPPMTTLNEEGFLIENFMIKGSKKEELTTEVAEKRPKGVFVYQEPCDWCW